MAQPRLFISYSRVDSTTAAQIAKRLRRAYDHVWFDEALHGGQDWWVEILDQIAAWLVDRHRQAKGKTVS